MAPTVTRSAGGHYPVRKDLTNALKYSPEDQPITVRLVREERTICLRVEDRGTGVPEDEQGAIWQQFHRMMGQAVLCGSSIGLGLGRYISKTIIALRSGDVGIESAQGQGSCFWSPCRSTILRNSPSLSAPVSRVSSHAGM